MWKKELPGRACWTESISAGSTREERRRLPRHSQLGKSFLKATQTVVLWSHLSDRSGNSMPKACVFGNCTYVASSISTLVMTSHSVSPMLDLNMFSKVVAIFAVIWNYSPMYRISIGDTLHRRSDISCNICLGFVMLMMTRSTSSFAGMQLLISGFIGGIAK